ncbi:DUF4286 family protein [Pontibacter sp. G13]|uniref:DUF4286 family protein n=1 Tax=Pontibacter sp. G13 TaxID=3074898 RepID=UPI00288BE3F4|nr:DUF4286 family protein [Pontibacter sp. G13]WNJ15979.1 DUF4286 family protein [Pontibacter sp. G13]
MKIYSVSVSVLKDVEPAWKVWMQETHIPEMMATGFFSRYLMMRLLEPIVDESMVTYSIQYWCEAQSDLDDYLEKAAPAMQEDHNNRFPNQFVAFRTILEPIQESKTH